MMAAVRILIWLPVRLARRSSISNMAFLLGGMFVSWRASRLHPAGARNVTLQPRRTEAQGAAGRVCAMACPADAGQPFGTRSRQLLEGSCAAGPGRSRCGPGSERGDGVGFV